MMRLSHELASNLQLGAFDGVAKLQRLFKRPEPVCVSPQRHVPANGSSDAQYCFCVLQGVCAPRNLQKKLSKPYAVYIVA
jgi:hypothetical protein